MVTLLLHIAINIAENVEAIYDCWILGDEFLKEMMNSLHALCHKAKRLNSTPPHIFQTYNVKDYHSGGMYKGIARMIKPMVEALNDRHRLPRFILVIPDMDILKHLKSHNINTAFVMGSALHYLIRQYDILLERHLQDLTDKKPGALSPVDITGIVWVRMLRCPASDGTLMDFT